MNNQEVAVSMAIDGLECVVFGHNPEKVVYLLSPVDGTEQWAEETVDKYGVSVVVIFGMDWDDDLTPWPSAGVPAGSPPFKGLAPEFLRRIVDNVLPRVEARLKCLSAPHRILVGISLSGLFALWQWMECDVFDDIASVSGSFWYNGFTDWLAKQQMPARRGRAYFSLGDKEALSPVPQFRVVAQATSKVVTLLEKEKIKVCFRSVPGNHYQFIPERLEFAMSALLGGEGF